MRLTTEEKTILCQTVQRADAEADTYLFGSRVDDQALGGDIDVLVLSKRIDILGKLDILATLHQALGDRKIDLVVLTDASQPFAQMAMQQGIRL